MITTDFFLQKVSFTPTEAGAGATPSLQGYSCNQTHTLSLDLQSLSNMLSDS